MKLNTSTDVTISTHNTGETGSFKISASAKAFAILSSGLYSNKIRAIIRELSCNAKDSHVAAGTPDTPFDLHLPTNNARYFYVRDYGVGLDYNEVTSLYTTYFESTKTNSNDYIGALGLGSKSPFSYVDKFTVVSWKDGLKSSYVAYIDEAKMPSITHLASIESSEPNGVEVRFDVGFGDIGTFKYEAAHVYQYFDVLPNLTGAEFTPNTLCYKYMSVAEGISVIESKSYQSFAIQGSIAYPIKNSIIDIPELNTMSLEIHFDIGELDVAASREELSYDSVTIQNIRKKIYLFLNSLPTYVKNEVDSAASLWEKLLMCKTFSNCRICKSAMSELIEAGHVPELLGKGTYPYYVSLPVSMLDGLECVRFSSTGKQTSSSAQLVSGTYIQFFEIPIEESLVVLIGDGKIKHVRRRAKKYADMNLAPVLALNGDPVKIRAVLDFLYGPSNVKQLSEVLLPTSTRSYSKRKAIKKDKVVYEMVRYQNSYGWKSIDADDITAHEKIYVVYDNKNILATESGLMGGFGPFNADYQVLFGHTQIYGVPSDKISQLRDEDGWVSLKEHCQRTFDSLDMTEVESTCYYNVGNRVLDNYRFSAADELPVDHQYRAFLAKVKAGSVRGTGMLKKYQLLSKSFGFDSLVGRFEESASSELSALFLKYPLLKLVDRYSIKEEEAKQIIAYIKLVDNAIIH